MENVIYDPTSRVSICSTRRMENIMLDLTYCALCSVVALAIVGMSLLLSMITRCGVVLRECCIVVKV